MRFNHVKGAIDSKNPNKGIYDLTLSSTEAPLSASLTTGYLRELIIISHFQHLFQYN